jgi:hypothetical protein
MAKCQDPVICGLEGGHFGCRECYLSYILQQKKRFKKLQSEYEKYEIAKVEMKAPIQPDYDCVLRGHRPETSTAVLDHNLASFWSKTPEFKDSKPSKPSKVIQCPFGESHDISMSSLISVQPKYLKNDLVCFSCEGIIRKNAKIFEECGHLFCCECSGTICSVCQSPIGESRIIEVKI